MAATTCITLASPLGHIVIRGSDTSVTAVSFQDSSLASHPASTKAEILSITSTSSQPTCEQQAEQQQQDDKSMQHSAVYQCAQQLIEYFEFQRDSFDVQVAFPANATSFQTRTWNGLLQIDFGTTCSYADLALNVTQQKQACRAIGNANNRNPIAIVVPCHRVIGANGSLVGYAGGIWRKKWLIDHEKQVLARFKARRSQQQVSTSKSESEPATTTTKSESEPATTTTTTTSESEPATTTTTTKSEPSSARQTIRSKYFASHCKDVSYKP
jgi:methylated-DNA-[protein]-cysteine S-methyltransferase